MAAKPVRPTKLELTILGVLWEAGPRSVREIQTLLNASRPTGYTTVLKMLQIMTEKGLVRRDDSDRTHIYESRLTEEQTQRQLVRDLVDRAFGGSASKLVLQALSGRRATPEELGEIRRLIESSREREGRDERD